MYAPRYKPPQEPSLISPAFAEDAASLLQLQRLVYRSGTEIDNDYSIPPLLQSLDELRAEFRAKIIVKALAHGKMDSSVRISDPNKTGYDDHLVVHPAFQHRGIGTQLMLHIGSCPPTVNRFELFTGPKNERNIRFHVRLSEQVFRGQRISDRTPHYTP